MVNVTLTKLTLENSVSTTCYYLYEIKWQLLFLFMLYQSRKMSYMY